MPCSISNHLGQLISVARSWNDDGMAKIEPFLELFFQGDTVRQPAGNIDLNEALFARQGKEAIDANPS